METPLKPGSTSSYGTPTTVAVSKRPRYNEQPLPVLPVAEADIDGRETNVTAAGTYGCLIEGPPICPNVTLNGVMKISKIVTDKKDIAETLKACQLLKEIDPGREMIVYPILEESCVIKKAIPETMVNTCLSKYKDAPETFKLVNTSPAEFTVFTMEQGIPLTYYIQGLLETEKEPFYKMVNDYFETFKTKFHIGRKITHGDIHIDNLVVIKTIPTTIIIKLIDFSPLKDISIPNEQNNITETLEEIRKLLKLNYNQYRVGTSSRYTLGSPSTVNRTLFSP
jgi:hypothetical protein